jgi:hypothetical protein
LRTSSAPSSRTHSRGSWRRTHSFSSGDSLHHSAFLATEGFLFLATFFQRECSFRECENRKRSDTQQIHFLRFLFNT